MSFSAMSRGLNSRRFRREKGAFEAREDVLLLGKGSERSNSPNRKSISSSFDAGTSASRPQYEQRTFFPASSSLARIVCPQSDLNSIMAFNAVL